MRPTSKNHVYIYSDDTKAALWSKVPVNIWDVEFDKLDPVTFKELYPDNCNAKDDVAKQWLLANFKWMCPVSIDSDVLADKNDYENEKWSRLDFEKAEEPVDASAVLPILDASGLDYYEPGDYDGCKWPCVDVDEKTALQDVDALLKPAGWVTHDIVGNDVWTDANGIERRSLTWSIVPLDHDDSDDSDEDEDEDGWHGILLTNVWLVDEDRYAEVLNAAGYRVLKHEDTGTCIAQVTFCGMSSEANQAHAGFLLAVDRGWPILTDKGWRRPVR